MIFDILDFAYLYQFWLSLKSSNQKISHVPNIYNYIAFIMLQ